MSWLDAASESEKSGGGKWISMANDKDFVVLMVLDLEPAKCLKDGKKYGTDEPCIKTVWVAQVLDVATNEVKLWDLGPKLLQSVAVDLEGCDITKQVYRVTRYGRKGDQGTKYKLKVERQMDKLDGKNYAQAQTMRHDLIASGYREVLTPPQLPAGFALDAVGADLPF
jgi:hypothetical protein